MKERLSPEKRLSQVQKVDELKRGGMSIAQACSQVGIKTPTYDYYKLREKRTGAIPFTKVEAPSEGRTYIKKDKKIAVIVGSATEIGKFLQEYL